MLVSWENVKRTAEDRVRVYIILSPIFSGVEVILLFGSVIITKVTSANCELCRDATLGQLRT